MGSNGLVKRFLATDNHEGISGTALRTWSDRSTFHGVVVDRRFPAYDLGSGHWIAV